LGRSFMTIITLFVIADEAIPRTALRHLLASEPGFKVLGEADTNTPLQRVSKLKPGVILFHEPGCRANLVQLITSVHKAVPGSAAVIIGRETHHAHLAGLFGAGALGYVLLRAGPKDLFAAVRAAAHGRRFVDPSLSDELLDALMQRAATGTKLLSQREQQVLRMMAHGHSIKDIAGQLGLSRKSVETYVARLRQKLNLRTRADMVRFALDTGIMSEKTSET
jgi:two-component system, NarL family, response regulator NreC